MSDEIRARILLTLDDLSREKPNLFVTDNRLAEALEIEVDAVKRHLDILEEASLISPANSMDGHAALLSPKGYLTVEKLRSGPPENDRPQVGF